eukprot:6721991-Prymnesium_polylepis.1
MDIVCSIVVRFVVVRSISRGGLGDGAAMVAGDLEATCACVCVTGRRDEARGRVTCRGRATDTAGPRA